MPWPPVWPAGVRFAFALPSSRLAWDNCPKGLVNDPYPGACRRYVDTNGDGICDLSQSEPVEATTTTTDGSQRRRTGHHDHDRRHHDHLG